MNAKNDYRWYLALSSQAVAAMLLFTGCSTSPVNLQAVGPKTPVYHIPTGSGNLVVYSDTEAKRLDKGLPFYVHTSYIIKNSEGAQVKRVPNHLGDMDQNAQIVALPSGTYQIFAESRDYGEVDVPVVIEAGRTTEVHLDGSKPGTSPAAEQELVRMPNGEPVGWRAVASNK